MSKRHANASPQSSHSLANGDASTAKGGETHWRQVLRKALTAQSTWDDKDDLLGAFVLIAFLLFETRRLFADAIYWLRQIISLIIGILWACVPLKGFLAIALYVAINSLIVHLYVTSFQKADEDELGTHISFDHSFLTLLIALHLQAAHGRLRRRALAPALPPSWFYGLSATQH